MKRIYSLLLSLVAFQAQAQVMLPGNPGNFGVDADVSTEKAHLGTFPATGSHDWLPTGYVSPFSVFDTSGLYHYGPRILLGQNFSFTKRMTAPAYTVVNGKLMLDGTYARDHYGLSDLGAAADKTVFVTSGRSDSKNFSDPSTWTTVIGGGAVPSKTDIIDAYIHMRRNGTSITMGNPSDLIVYLAASVLATEGDHHLDFELFRESTDYAPGAGVFTNVGPSATGGRHPWEFNADGTVSKYGNLSMSFSFNGTSVGEVGIYIWVHYSALSSVTPAKFEFVAADWNGANTTGYGFVRVRMKGGTAVPAFAAVNSSTVEGPQWGTNSKDGGKLATFYAHDKYEKGQFAEAAINLTAMGIDPALSTLFDKCSPPFRRVLVKSRSSSSFSSALQDFVGPMPFLDAPVVSADIVPPGELTCTVTGVTLQPQSQLTGAYYTWNTSDGNFTTSPNQAQVQVNMPGTYTLTASLYEGCSPRSQTVVVKEYKSTPQAKAGYLGLMADANNDGKMDPVTLTVEMVSKHADQDLKFRWTGPNGFDNSSKNPNTDQPGTYTLTVTEAKSGCACQDAVGVSVYNTTVLPIKITDAQAEVKNGAVEVSWSMDVSGPVRLFLVERSADGRNYQEVSSLHGATIADKKNFSIKDRTPIEGKSYYRIKAIESNGQAFHSRIMVVEMEGAAKLQIAAFARPSGEIQVSYQSERNEEIVAELYSQSGQLLVSRRQQVAAGANTFTISPANPLSSGVYVVMVHTRSSRAGLKVLK